MIGFSDLQADIARDLTKAGLNVLIFNQRSVQEILDMILALASLVGAAEKGMRLDRASSSAGWTRSGECGKAFPRRPRVYFEEWDEPMISGIRWVSELVEIAGGEDIFSALSHSQAATGRIVADPAPGDAEKSRGDPGSWCGKKFRPERVAARPGWQEIAAVKNESAVRDQVGRHPAARPGRADRRRAPIHEILKRSSDRASGTRARAAG